MREAETENSISSVSVSPEEGRYIYSTRAMMKPPSIIVATDRKPVFMSRHELNNCNIEDIFHLSL